MAPKRRVEKLRSWETRVLFRQLTYHCWRPATAEFSIGKSGTHRHLAWRNRRRPTPRSNFRHCMVKAEKQTRVLKRKQTQKMMKTGAAKTQNCQSKNLFTKFERWFEFRPIENRLRECYQCKVSKALVWPKTIWGFKYSFHLDFGGNNY